MFSRSRGRTPFCRGWARERPLFVFIRFQLLEFLEVARNGPVGPVSRCPFIGVVRTRREWLSTSEFDPKRSFRAPLTYLPRSG